MTHAHGNLNAGLQHKPDKSTTSGCFNLFTHNSFKHSVSTEAVIRAVYLHTSVMVVKLGYIVWGCSFPGLKLPPHTRQSPWQGTDLRLLHDLMSQEIWLAASIPTRPESKQLLSCLAWMQPRLLSKVEQLMHFLFSVCRDNACTCDYICYLGNGSSILQWLSFKVKQKRLQFSLLWEDLCFFFCCSKQIQTVIR